MRCVIYIITSAIAFHITFQALSTAHETGKSFQKQDASMLQNIAIRPWTILTEIDSSLQLPSTAQHEI